MSLLEDKKINMNRLDLEVSRQPEMYYEYGRKKSNAELKWNAAQVREEVMKQKYKKVKALVFSEVKKFPKKFGIIGKATDPIADAESENDHRTTEAFSKYIRSRMKTALRKNEYEIAKAAHESMIDRRKGIDNAVVLFINKYYSGTLNERRLRELVGEGKESEQRKGITPLPKRRQE